MLTRISKEVQDRTTREFLIYLHLRGVPNGIINNIRFASHYSGLFNEEAKEILDDLKAMYDSSRNGKPPLNSGVNDTAAKLRDLNQYLIDPQYKIPDFSTEEFIPFLYTECGESDVGIRGMKHVIDRPELFGDEIKQAVKEVLEAWDRYYFYKSDDAHAKSVKEKFMQHLPKFIDMVPYLLPEPIRTLNDYKIQDPTTREVIKFLYSECGISDEVVKNIIQVLTYIESYVPEIVNAIDEMKHAWESTDFNNPNQVDRLKQSLMNYVTTYFKDIGLYLWTQAIVTRDQHPTYRKILEFLSSKRKASDEEIQKLKWGIENSYAYKAEGLRILNDLKSAWESITNFNDPNQVKRLKHELGTLAYEFFTDSDFYLQPQEIINIVGKAKDPTYRELLMALHDYDISDEEITNMVHVINNPDMYNDEILNYLRNLRKVFYDHEPMRTIVPHMTGLLDDLKLGSFPGFFASYSLHKYLKPKVPPKQEPLGDIPGSEPKAKSKAKPQPEPHIKIR